METIKIREEFITLTQLLKLQGFIGTGGEAKHFLSTEAVVVNDEREDRRGKKLYPGDIVIVSGQTFVIQAE